MERPWNLEELRNVAAALPDPEKGVERFIRAVENIDATYKPTGRDWAAIFSNKLGLKWTEVRGTGENAFNLNAIRMNADAGAEGTDSPVWQTVWNRMIARMRLAYPTRPDWGAITNTKQLKGETVSAYHARLKATVEESSGLPEGTDNSGILKHHFVNGLFPDLQKAVRLTCIGWEAQTMEVVLQHANHAELNTEKKITEKQQKLENAQYMFYQSSSRPEVKGQGRGRWTGKKSGGHNCQEDRQCVPSPGDRQGKSYQWKTAAYQCYNCGEKGHWSRDCQNERKQHLTHAPPPPSPNNPWFPSSNVRDHE